jgi:hypothetical protein
VGVEVGQVDRKDVRQRLAHGQQRTGAGREALDRPDHAALGFVEHQGLRQ